ncbi:MAG: hypothetical protein ACFE9I_18630 [Candidatus Hermodarchaeota archaeon]
MSTFDDIESVDEIAERLDKSMELSKKTINISPKEEFWAHCSNLQVWAENDYNTCLLLSSLAFPLLEKLVEVGDPLAKKIFKEEIAKRLASGVESVVTFLFNEGYVSRFLTKEEFLLSYLKSEEFEYLYELNEKLGFELQYCFRATDPNTFHIENKSITIINLNGNGLDNLPEIISKFEHLKLLTLYGNNITNIPEAIWNLKDIKILGFY